MQNHFALRLEFCAVTLRQLTVVFAQIKENHPAVRAYQWLAAQQVSDLRLDVSAVVRVTAAIQIDSAETCQRDGFQKLVRGQIYNRHLPTSIISFLDRSITPSQIF